MKGKILIVARAFPPISGGGVQRIVKFSIYLKELGWDVTVCAPSNKNVFWKDKSREKELHEIKVIRINEKPISNGLWKRIFRKLKFYDAYNDWVNDVILNFKNKTEFKYDVVITSGPPHSIHRFGLELKNKFNFHWVSDFRDHFTLCPTFNPISILHKKVLQNLEQRIYDKSDLIITNTEINKGEVTENFNINPNLKVKTIYNGFDLNDLKLNSINPNYDKDKLNLLYLGGLRGDKIDGYFYRVVRRALEIKPNLVNEVKINLIGDTSRKGQLQEKIKIDNLFKDHGSVPFDNVGDYIKSCDGCLTWQDPNEKYRGTIAGKFFDYFGMKKAIFSLGQPNSELDKLINGNKIGINSDINSVEQASKDFVDFIQNINMYEESYQNLDDTYYKSFMRREQVNELDKYLLSLI